MSSYLFKNANLIDPVTGRDTETDVLIIDGVIAQLKPNISRSDAEIFQMKGMIAAPGFFDMHVHLREPGQEHKETIATGCLAAAAGGFTGVACMPNTSPAIDSADVVAFIKTKAERLPVDVFPIGAVTRGRKGEELAAIAEMVRAGAVAFSDDGSPVHNARMMRLALEYLSMFDAPLIQHAEEPSLFEGGAVNEGYVSTLVGLPGIPRLSEDVIVSRDIAIAEYLDCAYHVAHISTIGATDAVRFAKQRGLKVTCEVTPHHFSLTDEAVRSFNTNTKMNPPLRTMDDVIALKEALRDGVIDVIATDHAPHAAYEKDVEYVDAPFGIVGLETALGLAITELVEHRYLTHAELIEKFSTNPRKILRLPEIHVEEGQPANLTLFDPKLQWEVDVTQFRSKSKNSPFHGYVLTGKPIGIFNKEQLVWLG